MVLHCSRYLLDIVLLENDIQHPEGSTDFYGHTTLTERLSPHASVYCMQQPQI